MVVTECPICNNTRVVKYGKTRQGKQRYFCKNQKCEKKSFVLESIPYLLSENYSVYTKKHIVVNWNISEFEEKILPTVNHYMGDDGGYVAFYSHNKEHGIYSVGDNIYVIGQIRLRGKYIGRIFHPKDYEDKDISAVEEFKKLGKEVFGVDCWAGGDTGGWFGL